jgi:hypothetical protein
MHNIQVDNIRTLHKDSILLWKKEGITLNQQHFLALVEENHSFNYQLWDEEDKARRDDKGSDFVYQAKRNIDRYNQQRNNKMEAMDGWLHNELKPSLGKHCPVHSETPGMMIDRLSILALKAYHMHLQTLRFDVDPSHKQACQIKLNTIMLQQDQLYDCLKRLLQEVWEHKRTFRVYFQFKMYNDPTLNPELYQ